MANWCYVHSVSEITAQKESGDLSVDERYAILCNGKRYKKDSREWLHKGSKRNRHRVDMETESDSSGESFTIYNRTRGHYRRTVCTLKELLRDNNSNKSRVREKDAKEVHSCTSYINIDETAKGPEMFANYRKRRLASQNYIKSPYAVISERDLNSNTSERWLGDRYFVPIADDDEREQNPARFTQTSYENVGDTLEIPWPENFRRDVTQLTSNLTETTQDSTSCWRYTRSIPSDSSTVSTPDDNILDVSTSSPSCVPSPVKRCKRQILETDSSGDNSEQREDKRFKNEKNEDVIYEEFSVKTQSLDSRTGCGSPWVSIESIANSFCINENENKP